MVEQHDEKTTQHQTQKEHESRQVAVEELITPDEKSDKQSNESANHQLIGKIGILGQAQGRFGGRLRIRTHRLFLFKGCFLFFGHLIQGGKSATL